MPGTSCTKSSFAYSDSRVLDATTQIVPSIAATRGPLHNCPDNVYRMNMLWGTDTRLDKNSANLLVEGIKTFVQERTQKSFVYFCNLDGNLK